MYRRDLSGFGTLDLSAGTVDALIGTVTVGVENSGAGTQSATGVFTMGAGTLDATTFVIGQSVQGEKDGGGDLFRDLTLYDPA